MSLYQLQSPRRKKNGKGGFASARLVSQIAPSNRASYKRTTRRAEQERSSRLNTHVNELEDMIQHLVSNGVPAARWGENAKAMADRVKTSRRAKVTHETGSSVDLSWNNGFDEGGFDTGGMDLGDSGENRMDYGQYDWARVDSLEWEDEDTDDDSASEDDDELVESPAPPAPLPSSLDDFLRPSQVRTPQFGMSEAKRKTRNKLHNWSDFISCFSTTAMSGLDTRSCCKKKVLRLPAVSLNGCDLVEFEHCSNKCPSQPAMLGFLSKGYYPSAPKRPNFAISEDILHFYHDIFTHGSVSKMAFCIAVEWLIRRKGPEQLAYQLYKPLLSVYSIWVDIQLILQTMTRRLLHQVSSHWHSHGIAANLGPPSISRIGLDPESIRNSALNTSVPLDALCPACFGQEPSPEFAVVCFDGNMQQKRTTTARNDSRDASDLRLLFVENSFQSKENVLPSEACFFISLANYQEGQEDETAMAMATATCSRNFRAASEYKVSERFADNGVVAGCCRHDIVLRLHNISGTGERLLYAFRLLQSILDDPACPQIVVIFYDINCKFSKYVKKKMIDTPQRYARLRFGIGIFHTFAHEYSCQILFSPRNLPGVGLTDGEGCERFWAFIRHIIPSLRTSSEYTRGQIMTAVAMVVATERKNSLANTFRKSFLLALRKIQQSSHEVNEFCQKNNLNQKVLYEARSEMRGFFANPESAHQDIESRICELLHVIKILEDLKSVYRQYNTSESQISCDYMQLKVKLRTQTAGCIDIALDDYDGSSDIMMLQTRLMGLLRESGTELAAWRTEDGVFTERFYMCREQYLPFIRLLELKHNIWTQLLHRQMEFQELYRSSVSGTKEAGRLLGKARDRLVNVGKLIREYNTEVSRLNHPSAPPLLNEDKLTDLLLSDSDLWCLDRFQCDGRWAKDPQMRRAISSLSTLEQAEKELKILSQECQRFVNQQCLELDNLETAIAVVCSVSALHTTLRSSVVGVVRSLSQLARLEGIASFLSSSQSSEDEFRELKASLHKAKARIEDHFTATMLHQPARRASDDSDLVSRRLNGEGMLEHGDEELPDTYVSDELDMTD